MTNRKTRSRNGGDISTTQEEKEKLESGELDEVVIEKRDGTKYRIEAKE